MEAQIRSVNNNTPYMVNSDYNYGRDHNSQMSGNLQWMPVQQQMFAHPNPHMIGGVNESPPPAYDVAVNLPARKAASLSFG